MALFRETADILVARWPALLLGTAALASAALLWLVRETPLQLLPWIRIDGLGGFFMVVTCAALALAVWPARSRIDSLRALLAAGTLALAYGATILPIVALLYGVVGALEAAGRPTSSAPDLGLNRASALVRGAGRRLQAAVVAVAFGSLLVGYGALALDGALAYDDRTAGAALSGFGFWFVLLAAAIPLSPLAAPPAGSFAPLILRLAWLYPLVRLYSLGPWNLGWALAALLLGGALALWSSGRALAAPASDAWRALAGQAFGGLALAAVGLGSGAGIAAACYLMLAGALLDAWERGAPGDGAGWRLVDALPLAAPFVGLWMLIGAAVAGGVVALAGAAWLAGLLLGLRLVIGGVDGGTPGRAWLSLGLGISAPLLVLALAEPAIAQLQGGLTPFGDVVVWPWVGLATLDAGSRQTAVLPSVAVAGLMLVLVALVYLVARARQQLGPPAEAGADAPDVPDGRAARLRGLLRREVPWLDGLSGGERDGDDR